MEKKITKRDNYNALKTIVEEIGRTDLVEFINHEIELLDKKKSSDTKTKTQVENENIKNIIVETLRDLGKASTITELQNANTELSALSNQKISALLKQLVDTEIVVRDKNEKRIATFKAN